MSNLALVPSTVEKLSPLERLQALCDPGSLQLVRGEVLSRRMGEHASPGDGVVGATGRVDGRPSWPAMGGSSTKTSRSQVRFPRSR